MLLALAVVSAAVFAVPSMAMAEDEPLHLTPAPAANHVDNIAGGASTLRSANGTVVTCKKIKGTIKWENGTTAKTALAFEEECKATVPGIGTVNCSTINTNGELLTHLLTIPSTQPGVLITPGASELFASFSCAAGLVKVEVKGNGVIGTITSPENACTAATQNTTVITFQQGANLGEQKHLHVEGTATTYDLKASTNGGALSTSSIEGSGTVTFSEGTKHLECT